MDKPRIGQILIAEGAVSEEALARALGYQRATSQNLRLGSILLNWDLLGEDQLLAALAKLHHCVPATWADLLKATPEALKTFSAAYAVRLGAFPYAVDENELRVAFANPSDLVAIHEVFSISRSRLIPAVATEAALILAYHRFYGRLVPPPFREIVEKLDSPRPTPAPRRSKRPIPAVSAAAARATSRVLSPATATIVVPPPPPEIYGFQVATPLGLVSAASAAEPAPEPAAEPAPEPAAEPAPELAAEPVAATVPLPAPPMALPVEEQVEAHTRARIAVSVVENLLATFPRVLVLGVGRTAISGWTGRGPGLTPEIASAIRVPANEKTVLPDVARTGVPHFGPLERNDSLSRSRECSTGKRPRAPRSPFASLTASPRFCTRTGWESRCPRRISPFSPKRRRPHRSCCSRFLLPERRAGEHG